MSDDLTLNNDFVNALTRQSLELFIGRTFCQLNPGTTFLPNWHIKAIAYHLDLVRTGQIARLIIAMPPRSLKSIAASIAFPAFVHGHDPTREILCASYAQDLASKLHNDCRAVLRSPFYQQAFPNTAIDPRKDTESETKTTAGGVRFASSVGGVITGRGGDLIVIDDPLRADDAMSEASRNRVIDWYGGTLMSRLNDKRKAAIVIVSQRLHINDLIGHVQRTGDNWTVLELPAIADRDRKIQISPTDYHLFRAGSVLHPQREPPDVLEEIKGYLGSAVFSAQYLQAPAPPGGSMFLRKWIRRYQGSFRLQEGDEIIQSWDTASKTGAANDYSVCTTWLIRNMCHFLIDVYRERVDYPALRAAAIDLGRRYRPRMILIEDVGVGTGLIADVRLAGLDVKGVRPEKTKESRASIESAKFEGGRVFLPEKAPWLDEFEAELFSFPGHFHDDQVDSMSQALHYEPFNSRTRVKVIGMF